MASPSSSDRGNVADTFLSVVEHLGERRKPEESVKVYDVFINHRGPDVKKNVALQLYNSLTELGIHAYLDSEEKQLGTLIPSAIETAIWSARVHIAIFSKGYAESPWCLAELVLMRKTKANIIPVFYEVDPSELRYIKGAYQRAFEQYKKKSRHTDKLEQWKEALVQISLVGGHEIKKSRCPFGFRRTPDCTEIVRAVQREMGKKITELHVAEHPVGFPMLVEKFETECHMNGGGRGKARIAGICGMGGAGKTTLSKELYNRYREKYTRAIFLSGVREAYNRGNLVSLQQRLLEDLFNEGGRPFRDVDEGISVLKDRLARIPVVNFLIFLDDIDHKKQLQNLLVDEMKNKFGDSLIIISTRDARVLVEAEIPTFVKLEGLEDHEATELFCLHAFGQRTPHRGYEDLVDGFVQGCKGLPLSLQILGSHVKCRDQEFWNSALKKLGKAQNLHKDIKEVLQISIDSLDRNDKEIFMDVACFFIGYSKNLAESVWKASGWEAHNALDILKDKFIVEEIEAKNKGGLKREGAGIVLGMHDHLRDLGRELASQGTSSRRLYQHEVLKSSGSTGEFINRIRQTKVRCFHSFLNASTGTEITYFIAESDDWGEASASFIWLQLDLKSVAHESIPQSIPSWIPLQKLQCLRICNGRLTRLWEEHPQAPFRLKELQISETFLEVVPDLGQLDDLENVVLDAKHMGRKGWSLLESLGMNISTLCLLSFTLEGKVAGNPRYLIIHNFDLSEEKVLNGSSISRVVNLEIGSQNLVTNISIRGEHCPQLESLKLQNVENLIEIDLIRVETLNCLEINHCKNLKRVSNISDFTKLVELKMSECAELESELCLRSLHSLERIIVERCKKLKCVELIDCERLIELNICECPELESKLSLCCLSRLQIIIIDRCSKLKNLELDCEMLVELKISQCPELESELCLRNLDCLQKIIVDGCRKLKCLQLINCIKLVELNISECPELDSELCLSSLSCLKKIAVSSCRKLKCLELTECKKLVELNISECPELDSQLSLSNLCFLEKLAVNRCRKLKCLKLIDCKRLADLNVSECPELKFELCLTSLSRLRTVRVDRCRKLKRLQLVECEKLDGVSGMEGLEELEILKIQNCPELWLLPAENVSCWERITIDGCEKLNCRAFYSLLNLKIVTVDIGRAVEGAESILTRHLFKQVIGGDAVTEIDIPRPATGETSVTKIIICGLVDVESSTPLQHSNWSSQEFHLRKGRWAVTVVITDPKGNPSMISPAVEGMCCGILKRGFRVSLMEHQEERISNVLETICNNLYQK